MTTPIRRSLPLFIYLASSMRGPSSAWCRAVLCGVALWGVAASPPAAAQAPPPCESLLAAAEARYVSRAFAEAEDLVRDCLSQPGLADDHAIRAYRLLALVFLRQDDLAEARQAVVRLLGVSFAYEPDPVQDPPAYVGLVTSVKDQLRVARVLLTLSLLTLPLRRPPRNPTSPSPMFRSYGPIRRRKPRRRRSRPPSRRGRGSRSG